MNGDRSNLIAAAISSLAVLGLGAVSLNAKEHRFTRFEQPFPVFRESSRDHGIDQARRELTLLYRSLMKFAERTRRLPVGDPLNHGSEFRRELQVSDDDVRVPSEWGFAAYSPRYMESRCDGTPKPAFPPKGVRDVWMSCETGGDDPSVILLWSDGKIEKRPGGKRMAVRLRSGTYNVGPFGSVLVYPDEPGVPFVFRTLEQREQIRATLPPPQFRVYPFGMPMPMRIGMMSGIAATRRF